MFDTFDEKCASEWLFIFIISSITLHKITKTYINLKWAWSNEYINNTKMYVNTMFFMLVTIIFFIMWWQYSLLFEYGLNTGLIIVFVKIPKILVETFIDRPVKKYFRRHEHNE